MLMEKQKRIWLIIAIVLVLLIIIIVWPRQKIETPGLEDILEEVITEEVEIPVAPEPEIKKFKEPTVIVPEASPVSQEGIVLTEEGEATNPADVGPGSKLAPKQSKILTEEEKVELIEDTIQLEVSREKGYVPNEFKVKPGQAVTVLLTSVDNQTHTFRFKDRNLRGVAITVRSGESRATTFNAPTVVGRYEFIGSVPDHRDTEFGFMIVEE